jgi:hypothetical protein
MWIQVVQEERLKGKSGATSGEEIGDCKKIIVYGESQCLLLAKCYSHVQISDNVTVEACSMHGR